MKPFPGRSDSDRRLMSLDALRGFVMLWIVGGAVLVRQIARIDGGPVAAGLAAQMQHAAWEGVHFYDLIFPLFVFISGVALAYAVGAKRERGVPRRTLLRAVLRRVLALILLGLVYNGLLELDLARLRYPSVLGLIGVAYGIAAAVALVTSRALVPLLVSALIMAAVAAAQLLVPVPGHGPGVLTPAGALNGYLDRMLLPGRLFGKVYDPEGLLCIVSAAALTLLGLSCGRLLRAPNGGSFGKSLVLAATGALLLFSGKFLAPWYPPIKALWTTSYNLIAGGIALGLTALFYLVIDGWRLRGWSFVLRVVGLNSITIYLAVRFVDFGHTAGLLFGGLAARCGPWQPAVVTGATLLIEWSFLWLLYRREIFLKV